MGLRGGFKLLDLLNESLKGRQKMCSPLRTFQNHKALLYEVALGLTSQVPAGRPSLELQMSLPFVSVL